MSTLAYQEIRSFARDRVKNAANTKKVVSIALGIALSRSIQLPSSEAIDGYTHYADTVSYAVAEGACKFNENMPIDMDLVESTARAFWLKRYFSAYPMKVIPLLSEDEGHFMNKLSGVGHLVNPDTFVTCQDESSTIIALVNRIRALEEGNVAMESYPLDRDGRKMTPSAELAVIVGAEPLTRSEVTSKVWEYVKKNGLQDKAKSTFIKADATLKRIFKKDIVSMFEMTELLNSNLK